MFDGMVHWPAEFARRYRAEGNCSESTLGEAFDRAVESYAHREAVMNGPKRLTYGDFRMLVNRFTLYFPERRTTSGKRVVFQLLNV